MDSVYLIGWIWISITLRRHERGQATEIFVSRGDLARSIDIRRLRSVSHAFLESIPKAKQQQQQLESVLTPGPRLARAVSVDINHDRVGDQAEADGNVDDGVHLSSVHGTDADSSSRRFNRGKCADRGISDQEVEPSGFVDDRGWQKAACWSLYGGLRGAAAQGPPGSAQHAALGRVERDDDRSQTICRHRRFSANAHA